MDIDFLKSAPEDQIDMMMMVQMGKLPDFSGAYTDTVQMPGMKFTQGSSSSNAGAMPQITENLHTASSPSSFMNLPSTISLTASAPNQESATTLHFLTNTSAGKWTTNTAGGDHHELSKGNMFAKAQSQKSNSMAAMREVIFRIAAMQPIHIDPESVKPPRRRNVKISNDPQSVAARHRRERISERIRILQRLVPGGTKMDTASMLDEAIHYVKFLKNQVQSLERAAANRPTGIGFPAPVSSGSYFLSATEAYQTAQNVQQYSYSDA